MINEDTRKSTAIKILSEELSIVPNAVTRFTNGYCHSVYRVETDDGNYVLRVTEKENESFYNGSIKWLTKLSQLEIPVPQIIKHGQYGDVFYAFMTFIEGKDLGDVYHTLSNLQKCGIAKELVEIQRKVAALAAEPLEFSHFDNESWIARSRERIKQNGIFDVSICDRVEALVDSHKDYFLNVRPVPFLDDITTKNVLIHEGRLAGIVDVDEIGFGDPFSVVGLTNMALLAMEADTNYIDYWLDEMNADEAQRKAVTIYTLLSCIDFMGEQGMCFSNDKMVPVNQKKIALLNTIYHDLFRR